MGTQTEFRRHAQECVELANKAKSTSHRDLMLSMAQTWLRLADQAQREAEWTPDAPRRPGEAAATLAKRAAAPAPKR